ncbi:MAG: glycosyltransferase family 4 protein [Gemmatimonadota bacterium]
MNHKRIVAWPDWSFANPYQRLFYEALEEHAWAWVPEVPQSFRALRSLTPPPTVLHVHWPYSFWRSRGPRAARQWAALAQYALGLQALRASGTVIAWTVHDLEHLRGDRRIDTLGRQHLYDASDLVIHHTEWSRHTLREMWGPPRGLEVVMPHGNYDPARLSPAPREVTRAALGLSDRPLFLSFGRLDEYKGFDLIPQVAHALDGEVDFVITGQSGTIHTSLEGPGVTVLEGRRSEQELWDLLHACDGVLLPYRTITMSGALLAALTAGRGVVATDLPPFREVLGSAGTAAVLAAPSVDGLVAGVRRFLSRPAAERGEAARVLADRWSWPTVVAPVADALDRISAARSASRAL